MFRKKKVKFSFGDKWLIKHVSMGNKPGCCVPITKEAGQLSKDNDLVVVLKSNAFGDKVAEPNELAISRRMTVRSLCLLGRLYEFNEFPELVEYAKALLQKIEDMLVAEAIAYLYSYPRLDDNKNPYPHNMQRPDASLLVGLLFGYRACCIKYYLETRYFGASLHLERTAFNKSGVYLGVLCGSCLGDYYAMLNQDDGMDILRDLRESVNKGKPFGSDNWIKKISAKLRLGSTLNFRGRPKKGPDPFSPPFSPRKSARETKKGEKPELTPFSFFITINKYIHTMFQTLYKYPVAKFFLSLVFLFAFSVSAQATTFQVPGVMFHGGYKDGTEADRASAFQKAAAAKAKWVRAEYTWERTEPSPGVIDFAQTDSMYNNAVANGLDTMALLSAMPGWASTNGQFTGAPKDYNQWAAFVTRMVNRYKANVHHWEIWNEPDLASWAGTPAQFARLVSVAYDAIKAADPTATVWFGGLSNQPSFKTFFDAVVNDPTFPVKNKIDGVIIHIQNQTFSDIDSKINSIRTSWNPTDGRSKRMTVTELGYESDSSQGVPGYQDGVAGQIRYMNDIYAHLTLMNVEGGAWLMADDPGSGSSYDTSGLHMAFPTLTPKTTLISAYQALSSATPSQPKFQIGDRVTVTTAWLAVRSTPNGAKIGRQKKDSFGTVIGGPVTTGGYTWWQVDYDKAPDGWSAEDWLKKTKVAMVNTSSQVRESSLSLKDISAMNSEEKSKKIQELASLLQALKAEFERLQKNVGFIISF